MGVEGPQRFTYHLVLGQGGRAQHAVCSCGWRSDSVAAAGIAGALWDDHVAMHHRDCETQHWLDAMLTVEAGYQVVCGCGWESQVDTERLSLFDGSSLPSGPWGRARGNEARHNIRSDGNPIPDRAMRRRTRQCCSTSRVTPPTA